MGEMKRFDNNWYGKDTNNLDFISVNSIYNYFGETVGNTQSSGRCAFLLKEQFYVLESLSCMCIRKIAQQYSIQLHLYYQA